MIISQVYNVSKMLNNFITVDKDRNIVTFKYAHNRLTSPGICILRSGTKIYYFYSENIESIQKNRGRVLKITQ